ncbi:MAG TPA: VWA domain-containing protein, partial [Isosphaeraceae bacterium]|nr:VWA domain-containing protein [Isosphaeraceae bacterium]
MSLFEYSKWDGSQSFLPQSADKLFDQLSEYVLQYGENVLRNLEDPDEDDLPEIVQLIEKEGLIERDEEGKWLVTPKGIRRIQDKALTDLFQTFRRDSVGRHDTLHKGEGSVKLEDTRPYVYGDSLANINMHETLKNAYVRQGGGVPIRLNHEDYVV